MSTTYWNINPRFSFPGAYIILADPGFVKNPLWQRGCRFWFTLFKLRHLLPLVNADINRLWTDWITPPPLVDGWGVCGQTWRLYFPKAIFDLSFLLNPPPTSCDSCTLTPFAVANWLCKRCRDVIVIRQNVSYDSAVIQRANQSICYCGLFTEGTLISLLHCHCFGLQLDYHYFEMWHWYVLGV